MIRADRNGEAVHGAIRPDQIPDEVVEAAAKAAHDLWRKQASVGDDIREYPQWDDVSRFYKDDLRDQAEAAIAAALNAWPDVVDTHPDNIGQIVLQFKEASDD